MKNFILNVLILIAFSSPAFAQKGYLFIESVPDSAIVTIDGKFSERYFTPVLCTLSVGEHQIEIAKVYYETETIKVKIDPEAVTRRMVHFVKQDKFKVGKGQDMMVEGKYGQLTIISYPYGARVIADGEELTMTAPVTLSNLTAGKHRYSLIYKYTRYDTTIIVTGDEPQTATIDFRALKDDEKYYAAPQVLTKVVIVVPGCEYQTDEPTGKLLIQGVDAELKISTGDTGIALTHKELAEHRDNNKELSLPKTELTYFFEPYIDSTVQFDISTFASKKKKHELRESLTPKHKHFHVPASFNSGKEVNVRIFIEDDGDIVFRYW